MTYLRTLRESPVLVTFLLVDIDTGWGGALNIAKTIKDMTRSGAAGRT